MADAAHAKKGRNRQAHSGTFLLPALVFRKLGNNPLSVAIRRPLFAGRIWLPGDTADYAERTLSKAHDAVGVRGEQKRVRLWKTTYVPHASTTRVGNNPHRTRDLTTRRRAPRRVVSVPNPLFYEKKSASSNSYSGISGGKASKFFSREPLSTKRNVAARSTLLCFSKRTAPAASRATMLNTQRSRFTRPPGMHRAHLQPADHVPRRARGTHDCGALVTRKATSVPASIQTVTLGIAVLVGVEI